VAKKRSKNPPDGESEPLHEIQDVQLHLTARRRYLNYAMSVITARALPDVRDGLKPVQRRILYTMQHELRLAPGSKPLKCARIVGDVLGKFHPHGDQPVYEALVRMAQDFSLRYPLVAGHGNFGSLDGDGAAAYRYTEATIEPLCMELLSELPRETVDYRPNYDGKTREPVVLPARFPGLLVNGATGIAVGMATNIPPHNLGEVIEACEMLIENREASVADLMKAVKGPDFPTGGVILNSRAEIREIYESGQGSLKVRAEFEVDEAGRSGQRIIVTSIPYLVQKDVLVRSIGDLVFARKIPQLVDVRDESTKDVRIVLEVKKEADPEQVMAYLFKHTSLQTSFAANLTCLVPVEQGAGGACAPARLDLKSMITQFIDFRFHVVERRFQHDLRRLQERIHILEGFRIIFDALDEVIRIIRRSDGREDAAGKLMKRFGLDQAQVDAILELRLYRLARLEIQIILEELREKKTEAARIEKLLASQKSLWGIVRSELAEIREKFSDKRRTKIGGKAAIETEYSEEAFIVDEDSFVILSRDGWVKRVTKVGDKDKLRLRQGDELQAVIAGNTRSIAVFFTNLGSAYAIRINDIPPGRGYGDPIQTLFKFRDGERVIAALSLDSRLLSDFGTLEDTEGTIPKNHLIAVSSAGYGARFSLAPYSEVSTRVGRKYLKLRDDETVIGVHLVSEKNVLMVATASGRVLLSSVDEYNFLSGPGRGVIAIKLGELDRVIGSAIARTQKESLTVVTAGDRKIEVTPKRYSVTGRGGKGVEVIKRGGLKGVEAPEIEIPVLPESGGNGK
jgi:DNA gyrase subunit A